MDSNWAVPKWESLGALHQQKPQHKYGGDMEAKQGDYLIHYSLKGVMLSFISAFLLELSYVPCI